PPAPARSFRSRAPDGPRSRSFPPARARPTRIAQTIPAVPGNSCDGRLRQLIAQNLKRTTRPGFYRSQRLFQPLRHLGLRHAFVVGELDDFALGRREFLEGAL